MFDHLGRARSAAAGTWELAETPLFLLFSGDLREKFALEVPPPPAPRLEDMPSPVVLQAVWPQQRVAPHQSAYRIAANKPEQIPVFVYNFGAEPVEGRLSVIAPKGWKLSLPGQVKVRPGERVELALGVDLHEVASPVCQAAVIRGDFQTAGTPVLSLRLLPEPR